MIKLVSAVKCDSYDNELVYYAVKKALKEINFKSYKKNVLIKPNVFIPSLPGYAATTHPSVLNAVCRILKEHDCNVIIGESSGDGKTSKAFEISGVKEIADRYNANLISFELSDFESVRVDGKLLKNAYIAEPVLNADLVINVPKLKTHAFLGFTGGVKNLLGVMPGAQKQMMHIKAVTSREFIQLLLDLHQLIKPGLNIMDAIVGMEGGGPAKGTPKNTGYILASKNAIALDIIAQRLIGLEDCEYYRTINSNVKLKGSIGKVEYEKSGNFIDDAFFLPYSFKKFLRKIAVGKPSLEKNRCIKCNKCKHVCKFSAIKIRPYPIFFRDRCIKCYACYEVCPKNAIYIKKNSIVRSLLWLRETFLFLK